MVDAPDALRSSLADRYRIEREIGAGGMATVHLARDLRHGRAVALKVLRPDVAAAMGVERFQREVTLTAALQHPHILPLFDSGESAGFLYYVTPYVDGESLREKLERDGLGNALLADFGIARALSNAGGADGEASEASASHHLTQAGLALGTSGARQQILTEHGRRSRRPKSNGREGVVGGGRSSVRGVSGRPIPRGGT